MVAEIQNCSNKRPNPFSRRDNKKKLKNIIIVKIFFPRTNGSISTKLGTNHYWVKRSQDFTD